MKTIKSLVAIGTLAGLCLTQAHASFDLTPYGNQPSNSGNAIAPWVSSLVSAYNNTPNTVDLPAPTSLAFKVEGSSPAGYPSITADMLTIIIPTGAYDYVAFHWGNGQSGNQAYQLFYIGGAADVNAGAVTFTAPAQNGLSWYSLWGPTPNNTVAVVPEASTWIAGALLMLPLGISAFRFARQRLAA